MDANQRLLVIGIYLHSALYLSGTFIAGLMTNRPMAWRMALVTSAVCYFAYYAQVVDKRMAAIGLVLASIFCGALAGFALLVG